MSDKEDKVNVRSKVDIKTTSGKDPEYHYYLPSYGRTIKATNLNEAIKKAKEMK